MNEGISQLLKFSFPQDQAEWDYRVQICGFFIEGVGITTVGTVGLFINAFALYTLFRKKVCVREHERFTAQMCRAKSRLPNDLVVAQHKDFRYLLCRFNVFFFIESVHKSVLPARYGSHQLHWQHVEV